MEKVEATAKKERVAYSRCIYKTVKEVEHVLVGIPARDARYMRVVTKHNILSPQEDKRRAKILEIPSHYMHGDFPRQRPDGTLAPAVLRHFFVSADDCGKKLVCAVEMQTKTNLVSGEKTIILNIFPEKDSQPEKILKLGSSSGQMKIPGTERYINFKDF